jgi:hydroxymethylpyrimidine kinase/phosphomethylpyrimidine kinase
MEKKVALSIAGSDSSGGAGIQADLKSFQYLGVHGVTVVTCVTAQNTQCVNAIFPIPLDMLEQQIDSICDDFPVTAVKTGMLYDPEIVHLVAKKLTSYHLKPVVDPVMVATSGDALSKGSFTAALKQSLLPTALMVTANIPEASILAGRKIRGTNDVQTACKKIYDLGPQYVLVKGGHSKEGDVTDVLYDGKTFHRFTLPRIPQKKVHGSGCTLSALITGLLALGEPPVSSVEKAKYITWSMIQEGYSPGKGADMLNHSSTIQVPPLIRTNGHFQVWHELKTAVQTLVSFLPPQYIPEVGMNFTYALPKAKTRDDICAVAGRITTQKDHPVLCGTLDFGASKHVASIVLAAMTFDPTMRSALNIRYSQKTVDRCKKIGFIIGTFQRTDEPPTAGSTMEWGTKHAISTLGKIPDVISDAGGVGKEPMIRLLGKNPDDVVQKFRKLINASFP